MSPFQCICCLKESPDNEKWIEQGWMMVPVPGGKGFFLYCPEHQGNKGIADEFEKKQ